MDASNSPAYSRGFTRVGGHGCFLNHSLPLHTTLSPFSLFPRLVHVASRHSLAASSFVTSPNNVPNDRLFSSGDIDLPANRKPVKMNPLDRYATNFVTARNAPRINLPPRTIRIVRTRQLRDIPLEFSNSIDTERSSKVTIRLEITRNNSQTKNE